MPRTKKVGSLGRYGPRIGGKVRREAKKIEDKSRESKCPSCGRKVRRISAGIWECRFCRLTFAGGAYLSIVEKTPVAGEAVVEEKPEVKPQMEGAVKEIIQQGSEKEEGVKEIITEEDSSPETPESIN